jgi:soluble lytic murein transglycosylase-like protein
LSTKLLLCFAGVASALAQAPPDFRESVRAAMAPALAQQRASIERQSAAVVRSGAAAEKPSSFFTLPFALGAASSADCDPLPAGELDSLVDAAAEREGVDSQLVRAVIQKESDGRPCAISSQGAQGLMQLMPATAEQFDVEDPFDPQQNVQAGTRLLRLLLDRYDNNTALALSAYNAGPSRAEQAGGVPAIPETLEYVSEILAKLGLPGTRTPAEAPLAPAIAGSP